MHGTFVWNELATSDVAGAKAFYEAAFGWRFEPFQLPGGEFWVAKVGERYVAGVGGLETGAIESDRPYWFSYIEVDDVDAVVARVIELGGSVIQQPVDVPEVGRIAVIRDSTGGAVGCMTPVHAAGG